MRSANFVFWDRLLVHSIIQFKHNFEKYATKKNNKNEELLILGSPIGELCQKELLDEKIRELEKISDVIDKLDAHYDFLPPEKKL